MWYFFCVSRAVLYFFFFFQAEDGIRDKLVTGVQTCALPISRIERGAVSKAPGGCDQALEYLWDTRPLRRRWARHHLSSRKPTTADSRRRRVGGDAVLTILPGTYRIGAVLPDHPRDHCGTTQCAPSSAFRPSARARAE